MYCFRCERLEPPHLRGRHPNRDRICSRERLRSHANAYNRRLVLGEILLKFVSRRNRAIFSSVAGKHDDVVSGFVTIEIECYPWIRGDVLELDLAGVAVDQERRAVPVEPNRTRLGRAIRPHRREPDNFIALQSASDPGAELSRQVDDHSGYSST